MFIQFRPWLDCDRHCSFCYLNEQDRSMPIEEKRNSLMKLSGMLHNTSKGYDMLGLIGGELFNNDRLYQEWCCVAESLRNADHIKRLFIGSHLMMDDVSLLLDFAYMTGKEVQICTSYDSNGRFDHESYNKWLSNIEEVKKEGHRVICSATITDALMKDKVTLPDDIEFKIQPTFHTESWLEEISKRCVCGSEYNAQLVMTDKASILVKRGDFLEYLAAHKDVAAEYATYNGKHADVLWDYDRYQRVYVSRDFVCGNYRAECGHPMIARCYADSDKCTMCDAKMVSE